MKTKQLLTILISIIFTITFNMVALAQHFSNWSVPVKAESIPGRSLTLNTGFNEDCPIQAPDGLSLFIASNRPSGNGLSDIYVTTRQKLRGNER